MMALPKSRHNDRNEYGILTEKILQARSQKEDHRNKTIYSLVITCLILIAHFFIQSILESFQKSNRNNNVSVKNNHYFQYNNTQGTLTALTIQQLTNLHM
jgi:hypothetical protein